jgi:hypothetical protein
MRGFCPRQVSTRTRLRVALSTNLGASWTLVAKLEERVVPLTKFHYPTLIPLVPLIPQSGCSLGVMYTVGMKEQAGEGGVRAVVLDLSRIVRPE